jgi:hypothetical protein
MRDRVLAAARSAGRAAEEITCALNLAVRIDDTAGYDDGSVTGNVDAVIEQLNGLVGWGFTALNLAPTGPGRDNQVERLAREVLPAVRA